MVSHWPAGTRDEGSTRAPHANWGNAAHTISQRLRQLKKIPAELIPLGMSFRSSREGSMYIGILANAG